MLRKGGLGGNGRLIGDDDRRDLDLLADRARRQAVRIRGRFGARAQVVDHRDIQLHRRRQVRGRGAERAGAIEQAAPHATAVGGGVAVGRTRHVPEILHRPDLRRHHRAAVAGAIGFTAAAAGAQDARAEARRQRDTRAAAQEAAA
jgi:hypothetical protein